ncbi:MAG: carboxymuconolactone decarboxylase family protein [Chloroflexi bacterium]|nr:carboxymuconolactone decarboxylase family protein [Chloroflexota bacterium]
MPRLPNYTERESAPPELRATWDAVAAERGGSVSGPWGALLASPPLAERGARLGHYLRFGSLLTDAQRETAILAAAREHNARLAWASHVPLARAAGIREQVIEAIGFRGPIEELDEEAAEIVRYVRELVGGTRVSEDAFEALRNRLGERALVELTGLLGYYALVCYALNAFELEPPEGSPRLPGAAD